MSAHIKQPAIGRDALEFVDTGHSGRSVTVYTYRPGSFGPDDRVVLVHHGARRNGDEYRDFWVEAAQKHRLLIVATAYSVERFPGAESFNNGCVIAADGGVNARDQWIYGIPGRVFAALRAAGVTRRQTARVFGHSAGGQFSHRLLALEDHGIFEAALVANPGWYTLPTLEKRFPEGLGGLGMDIDQLARWFAYPMAIFAGECDVDTTAANLPRNPEALAQGPTRFARAHYFYDFARRESARLGLACNWRIVPIPGVGHDGCAMSKAAAAFWFEGRIPTPSELGASQTPVA